MKTALIVDNSRLVRAYLKELLQGEGFEKILEASSAKEAIAAFNEHKPDLMTLDIIMPEDSGIDVLDAISPQKHQTKIVIVTDFGQESVVQKALQTGASSVIYKPVRKDALKAAIEGRLEVASKTKPKALVVDDSMMMRVLVRDFLEKAGCEVIGEGIDVPSGIKAYQELKPDLMTLDLVMPGGSGIDVLKSVMGVNPKANVIIISAVSQGQITQELMAIGAKTIINKPITGQKISEALAKTDIPAFKSAPLSSPSPSSNGNGTHAGWNDFREMLKPATEKCVEALNVLSQSKWVMTGMDVYERTSYNMQVFPPEVKDIVFVQMSVSNDVPVMGLFGAPHDQFLKMAQKMLESHFSSLADKDGTVRLMILEWANIIVTNFLNVFADALGYAVLSTPPEIIDSSVEEAIRKSSVEISDIAKKVLAAQIRFSCLEWNASCETILMVREDCLDRILPKKK